MAFGDLWRTAADRLGLGPSRRELLDVRGLRVAVENTRPDIETATVLERLDEALALIERYQPWRLVHLRQDVREIRVVRFACRGAFFPADRAVVTELTFLGRRDIGPGLVASSIVHEGVHARVHAMAERLAWSRDWALAREERLCRRAELALGRALPAALGTEVVERAAQMLALADADVAPTVDWREAEARVRGADRAGR